MNLIKKYIGDLFLNRRFFQVLVICILLFIAGFYIPLLLLIAGLCLLIFTVLVLIEYALLFFTPRTAFAKRITAQRLSMGEENTISLFIKNELPFPVFIEVIDEIPTQLQLRNWKKKVYLKARRQKKITWSMKPLQRGEYHFGNTYLFVTTPLKLISRRFTSEATAVLPVYPAFTRLHQYQLLSSATLGHEHGTRRMRKIGQSMEFEQIRDYVSGDDIRTLNWKASARKGGLMVNHFMEERSQQVYCIIDKGRLMKMPFNGLTLLDHAINATLVVSSVCLNKQDRVGLITFSNTMGSLIAADRKPVQTENILQVLYKQETDFLESDFEMLYQQVRHKIRHRSLLILFTNFESLSGLHRQLDYLRSLAKHHLLLVVFFENTELQKITGSIAKNLEEVYIKTVAEKFAFEKRLIARELKKYGILSILTSPEKLTVNTINKYLELKTRQAV